MPESKSTDIVGTLGSSVRTDAERRTLGPSVPTNCIVRTDAHRTHEPCVPTNFSALPQRKSPRATFHDYSGGNYFVTICTKDTKSYFGRISNGGIKYTAIGRCCVHELEVLASHYPYAEVPLFVVMPNHIHAIICIEGERTHEPCVPTKRSSLSIIVGGFKRAVTMFSKQNGLDFGWQPRYHDHIIRNNNDGNKIAKYIETNIQRWEEDCFHPFRKRNVPRITIPTS